jgi:ribulose-5-phosphate 4-epimerase/fuculose-1-phosphate aldolase
VTASRRDEELRAEVALACRILANEGLVEGVLGHVSVRVAPDELLIRCRGPYERGVAFTTGEDIRRVDLEGNHVEDDEGWSAPKELPIHSELYRTRPEVQSVVHAHPPSALLCGLAGLRPRPVFGAYNIPAMRLALDGVPVYPRSVLITRRELADEMLGAMGSRPVCLLAGHGITVAGESLHGATVRAVDLETLLSVTASLARLGASPPELPEADLAELPDLGSAFNDELAWNALAAKAELALTGPRSLDAPGQR